MTRHAGVLRERVASSWLFESPMWGISSGIPLASHVDLAGSESALGLSQDPPMCRHELLSQDGFQQRGLWVALAFTPFLTSKELSSQEGFPDFENEKHVVSLLDRAQPPLSVDTLEFLSAENELQCSPGVGGAPSLSETCPEHTAHLHPC